MNAHRRVDRWGLGVSLACLAHCAALPLVAVILPGVLGEQDALIHGVLLVLAVPIAVLAFADARSDRAARGLAMLAATGLGAMTLAMLVHQEALHTAVTFAGVSIVAIAHFLNQRRRASG